MYKRQIEIAGANTIATEVAVAENDPQGLSAGQSVTVCPDVESNEQSVPGTVRMANAETIAIDRLCETTNTQVCVHFPRAGYRVETVWDWKRPYQDRAPVYEQEPTKRASSVSSFRGRSIRYKTIWKKYNKHAGDRAPAMVYSYYEITLARKTS